MTQFRQVGNQSPDTETTERLATEETVDAIAKVLRKTARVSAGGSQRGLSITSSAAVRLTVPQGATEADIYVRTAAVVFSRDGVAPTATSGDEANATDYILLSSADELARFSAIAVSASATLDVSYFRYAPA